MKQTIIFIAIFFGLLYWNFSEYYEHLNAFNEDKKVTATIEKLHCGKRSSLQVAVQNSRLSEFVRSTRIKCSQLNKGDNIELLQANSGNLYWNEEPSKRVFWFIPAYLLMAGYMFLWHHRKRKR